MAAAKRGYDYRGLRRRSIGFGRIWNENDVLLVYRDEPMISSISYA
jgi:hypothetical protein